MLHLFEPIFVTISKSDLFWLRICLYVTCVPRFVVVETAYTLCWYNCVSTEVDVLCSTKWRQGSNIVSFTDIGILQIKGFIFSCKTVNKWCVSNQVEREGNMVEVCDIMFSLYPCNSFRVDFALQFSCWVAWNVGKYCYCMTEFSWYNIITYQLPSRCT